MAEETAVEQADRLAAFRFDQRFEKVESLWEQPETGITIFVVILLVLVVVIRFFKKPPPPEPKPKPKIPPPSPAMRNKLARALIAAENRITKFEANDVRVKTDVGITIVTLVDAPAVEVTVKWETGPNYDAVLYVDKQPHDKHKRPSPGNETQTEIESHPINYIDHNVTEDKIYRYYAWIELTNEDGKKTIIDEQYIIHKARLVPLTPEQIEEQERVKKEKEAKKAAKAKKKKQAVVPVKKPPPPEPTPKTVEDIIKELAADFVIPAVQNSITEDKLEKEIMRRFDRETEGLDPDVIESARGELLENLEAFMESAKNKTTISH